MSAPTLARIAFRVAAAPGVGLGHATRCRILSEHFTSPLFVTDAAGNCALVGMGIPPAQILALAEGEATADRIYAFPEVAAVVVDTLNEGNAEATTADVAALVATGRHVTVIDSMPPDHFRDPIAPEDAPDLLITPYLRAEELRPPPRARCWLAGAGYAILPTAFEKARLQPFPDMPRILVACGGADPTSLSARIAGLLAEAQTPVDIVVGPQFDAELVAALEQLAGDHPHLSLHKGRHDLMPLYLSATVVVGRPGLLRYEVAALGRTGIYLWETDNYIPYFEAFHESGLAEIYLAAHDGGGPRFDQRIAELTQASGLRQMLGRNETAAEVVDGRGGARIAEAIGAGLRERTRKERT